MSDGGKFTRRSVLAGVAGAAGLATGVAGFSASGRTVVGSSPVDGRFIVDTRPVSGDSWRNEVTVVHDLSEIGIAVVEADKQQLESKSLRFTPDFEIETSPPETITGDLSEYLSEDEIERRQSGGRESGIDQDRSGELLANFGLPGEMQWDQLSLGTSELHLQDGIIGSDTVVSVVDDGVVPDDIDIPYSRDGSNTIVDEQTELPGAPAGPDQRHGTSCASVIGGAGILIALGVAPGTTVISQNVFGTTPGANFGDVVTGIIESVNAGADVINLSLGAYPLPPTVAVDLIQDAQERAGELAVENGSLPVVAAGNDGSNLDTDGDVINLPAQNANYMSASATGPIGFEPDSIEPFGSLFSPDNPNNVNGQPDADADLPAIYTNYGQDAVDVSAPGGNIGPNRADGSFAIPPYAYDLVMTTAGGGSFTFVAGTSFAAPQVSGLAALVKSQNPDATPEQVRRHIRNTAQQITDGYEIETYGTYFGPGGQLSDPYSSATYRGQGHIDAQRAARKSIPFEGGVTVGISFDAEQVFPVDPDDDGLYEDVNGDGSVDMEDARLLYRLALSGAPADADSAFDFDGDGQFTLRDVQTFIRDEL